MSGEFPIKDNAHEKMVVKCVTDNVEDIDGKIRVFLNKHMEKFSQDYAQHGSLKLEDQKRFDALVQLQVQKMCKEALELGKGFNQPHFIVMARKSLWELRLIFYRQLDMEIKTEFSLMFRKFLYILQTRFPEVSREYMRELCFHLRNDIDVEPYNNLPGNKGKRLFTRYASGTATVVEKLQCMIVMQHLMEKLNLQYNLKTAPEIAFWREWKKEKIIACDKLRSNEKEDERVYEYTGDSSLITPNGNTPYSCPIRLRVRSIPIPRTTENGTVADPYLEYLRCGFYENFISSATGCWNNYPNNAPYDLDQVSLTFQNPDYNEATVLESVAYLESLNQ